MAQMKPQISSVHFSAKLYRNRYLSIFFLALSFFMFSIATPLLQDYIDSKNTDYFQYLYNLNQASLKHSQFIIHSDIYYYLGTLKNDININENDLKKINERLIMRGKEHIADYIASVTFDPADDTIDLASEHSKLRNMPLDELIQKAKNLPSQNPLPIGKKYSDYIKTLSKWKNLVYFIGSLSFILGTLLQLKLIKHDT